MAEITAALVKDLREKTGAGMMDCKKALTETGGDMEAAVDWLRKKGLSAAAKKSGRVAAEGLVGVASAPGRAAMVEVNAETDFVARNETFQAFVDDGRARSRSTVGEDVEAISAAPFPGTGRTVGRGADPSGRHDRREHEHPPRAGAERGQGRGGDLRAQRGEAGAGQDRRAGRRSKARREMEALETLGRQVGMHVAAARPEALDIDRVDPAALEREKAVLAEQARASGKPESDHREDGRGPHPQILRGSGAAGAGLGA